MNLLSSRLSRLLLVYFLFQSAWWIKLHTLGNLDSFEPYWFNISYGVIGLIGGLHGLSISKRWGGWSSMIGKSVLLLSFGLLSEWLAVTVWSFYNIVLKVEVPYPSIADLFYFAIIPLYSFAMISLANSAGAKFTLKRYKAKLNAILIPLGMLALAYYLFLKEGLEFTNSFVTFFDLGYPLGYAITLSIAILTYFLTRSYLGGMMKTVVLFVLVAYLVQFTADYGFLYTNLQGTYYNANWVDLLYAAALTVMSIAIIQFGNVANQMFKKGKQKHE